jgi:diaminopimelate decarboxylase
MDFFRYKDGRLFCEDVAVDEIMARVGSPVYIYSKATFLSHYDALTGAFAELKPIICYSIKSCGNLNIVKLLADRGSGMDVVSGGELFRAQQAGADMSKVVYAGVGKTDREIIAALEAGIGWFNIESEAEFENIAAIAERMGKQANGALRVNPDVYDARTHAKTTTGKKETKFGVDLERAAAVFREFGRVPSLKLCAIHLHIGSPVHDVTAYEQSIRNGLELIERLRKEGHEIDTIDVGGGFGAHYRADEAPPAIRYADTIVPLLRGRGLKVILEPGRSISANAGILLARVLHIKQSGRKAFAIIDASMNELIRPALYGAYHFIWPVRAGEFVPETREEEQPFDGLQTYDVVGPVCESGDFLAKDRRLPPLKQGDLLAVFTAGAYGMVMSSQYNSRPRAAEVLVDGDDPRLIRRRETYEDLLAAEMV